MEFKHIPVLLNEVMDGLNIRPDGIYVDGTLGGAGHSLEIVKKLSTRGRLIGIDQDEAALSKAREVLRDYEDRVSLVHSNYEHFDQVLDHLGIEQVDGILLDIGVSSYQFDEGERGFSYQFDAPLDMRMNTTSPLTAADIVNEYSETDLQEILFRYGEESWAKRIVEFIVKAREQKTIETTFELVEIIKAAIPKQVRRDGGHPARKTFQALRIAVNDELGVLERTVPKMVRRLRVGGRLAIITFHSLEDRIVKQSFKELYQDCICPPDIPNCICDKRREIEIITRKPIVASKMELENNYRARSAKLRVAERR